MSEIPTWSASWNPRRGFSKWYPTPCWSVVRPPRSTPATDDPSTMIQCCRTSVSALMPYQKPSRTKTGGSPNRVTPGKVILGRLGDIEAGVRQMIRSTPLEVAEVVLPSGRVLRVPTPDEILRVKGFLIVRRNQTRDFLDVMALADRYGVEHSGRVLAAIDAFYTD